MSWVVYGRWPLLGGTSLGLVLLTARCGGSHDSKSAPLCPSGTDGCYFLLEDTTRIRDDANTACAANTSGGHLATFRSKDTQDAVMAPGGLSPKAEVNDYWFALDCPARDASCNSTADGVWRWITGRPLEYKDWPSDPNDASGCAGLRRQPGGFRWDDHDCTKRYFAVCEAPRR